MTRQLRTMLRGAGSVLDLSPDPHAYLKLASQGTTADRLGNVWARVGKHIRAATEQVRAEQARDESAQPPEVVC